MAAKKVCGDNPWGCPPGGMRECPECEYFQEISKNLQNEKETETLKETKEN